LQLCAQTSFAPASLWPPSLDNFTRFFDMTLEPVQNTTHLRNLLLLM